METTGIYNNVCRRVSEIDELLRVTTSWHRVMQLNPDAKINGEDGVSISARWESAARDIKDLTEDIDCLTQEEMLQVADMIQGLRQRFRAIERKMRRRTKAFTVYIGREASRETRVMRAYSHDYWAFIYSDMQLVVNALSNARRNMCEAVPSPTVEDSLPLAENDETPILRRLIGGNEVEKYLRFCAKKEYYDRGGRRFTLTDSKRTRLLKHIGGFRDVGQQLKSAGYKLYDLHSELSRAGVVRCQRSAFNEGCNGSADAALKDAWAAFH